MLQLFSKNDITSFVSPREGETKLGQSVQTISNLENIHLTSAKFVIIGAPEDIGVKMNYGNGGAHTAFTPTLKFPCEYAEKLNTIINVLKNIFFIILCF